MYITCSVREDNGSWWWQLVNEDNDTFIDGGPYATEDDAGRGFDQFILQAREAKFVWPIERLNLSRS